jgi:probable rRNA maturation factor
VEVTIVNHSGRPVPRTFLQGFVQRMEKSAARAIDPRRFRNRELVIAFLGEKDARKLNLRYRKRDYATDVLSFASEDENLLGELVICPAVISRQAKGRKVSVREELSYMVLHGFLHLLGYDHETSKKDAEEMFSLQDKLFERVYRR